MKKYFFSSTTNNEYLEKYGLVFVFLIAFLMRIFVLFQSSMTHDELSAVFRCKMPDFSHFLEIAIYSDTHPPLIQLFIYAWTKCFGIEDWVVKFPFFIFGMLSLYYTFLLAKVFTKSHWIALFSVVLLSCTQLHLTYSIVARMYISGLFFSVAMLYYWWSWIKVESSNKNYCFMLFFAFLASYNHHLSMLLMLMVWFSGVFFTSKAQIKKYIFAFIIFLVLYIPCAYISYFQLTEIQGLAWLAAPDYSFFPFFFSYLTSYNWVLMLLYGIGFLIYFIPNKEASSNPIIWVAFLWFLASLIITFYYSVLISPIIQVHLFIFTVPFLLILIATGIGRFIYKPIHWLALIVVYFLFNMYVLTCERKFYELFPQQPYKVLAESVKKQLKQGDCIILTKLFPHYVSLYFNETELNKINFVGEYELGTLTMDSILPKYSSIVIANNDEAISSVFAPYYTSSEAVRRLQSCSFQVLKRNGLSVQECLGKDKKDHSKVFESQNFREKQLHWEETKNPILIDALSGKDEVLYGKGENWFSVFNLNKEIDHPYALSIEFKADSIDYDAILIVSIKNKDQTVYYSARHFNEFVKIQNKEWQRAYVSFPQFICLENKDEVLELSFACHKTEAGTIKIRNAKILSIDSNPYLFSIVADIEE